jgi:Holliday junction resolvasome RuvABC endonuclease subunit
MIAGIDPGLRQCGVAIVNLDGELQRAWLAKSTEHEEDGAEAWEAMANAVWLEINATLHTLGLLSPRLELVAIERQAIRGDAGRGLLTKNPQVIVTLANVAGAVIQRVQARTKIAVWPQSWNGNKRKDTVTDAVLSGLRPVELGRLDNRDHNTVDAIGIAKYAARRWRSRPNLNLFPANVSRE